MLTRTKKTATAIAVKTQMTMKIACIVAMGMTVWVFVS
jgi:hypothetical protein